MSHTDPHKVNGYCLCLCTECVVMVEEGGDFESECQCPEGCNCQREMGALHPAYYPEPEEKPQHLCETCGVEVFRKGDRGRFPKKCQECK